MIVLVEGPRHSGKTHLLNKFFEQNKDPRIEYYKWYLVDWIKTLGLEGREQRPDVHYLSLGNILTIFDMMKDRNDKILVFDRALMTAYVWASLRGRLTMPQCYDQLERILKSDSYRNTRTIFVNPNLSMVAPESREKDLWDNMHSAREEYVMFDDFMLEHRHLIHDRSKNNLFCNFYNEFNKESEQMFTGLLDGFTELINT